MEKSIQVLVLTSRKCIDFWFTIRFYRVDPVKSLPKKGAGFEMSPCGRVFHPDKRGVLDENMPPILKRIGIEPAQFIECAGDFMHIFGLTVGSPDLMAECCTRRQVKFLRGIKASRELLGAA